MNYQNEQSLNLINSTLVVATAQAEWNTAQFPMIGLWHADKEAVMHDAAADVITLNTFLGRLEADPALVGEDFSSAMGVVFRHSREKIFKKFYLDQGVDNMFLGNDPAADPTNPAVAQFEEDVARRTKEATVHDALMPDEWCQHVLAIAQADAQFALAGSLRRARGEPLVTPGHLAADLWDAAVCHQAGQAGTFVPIGTIPTEIDPKGTSEDRARALRIGTMATLTFAFDIVDAMSLAVGNHDDPETSPVGPEIEVVLNSLKAKNLTDAVDLAKIMFRGAAASNSRAAQAAVNKAIDDRFEARFTRVADAEPLSVPPSGTAPDTVTRADEVAFSNGFESVSKLLSSTLREKESLAMVARVASAQTAVLSGERPMRKRARSQNRSKQPFSGPGTGQRDGARKQARPTTDFSKGKGSHGQGNYGSKRKVKFFSKNKK